jgi:glycosyltransferase involved in cell wall biosynthesis
MTNSHPSISAIICTRNRAKYLRGAIESLRDQSLPPDQYEIIVIDNGSSDETRQVVQSEYAHVPNLRYIAEPVVGLSQARNTGWRAARSEYVAYLDDDAVAAPCWVSSILRAFADVIPRPGCVGGPIDLMWEDNAPDWVPFDLYCTLGFCSHGTESRALHDHEYNAGGNMAFPCTVLQEVGGFSNELGRRRLGLLSNEELLIERRIRGKGFSCYYVPAASVKHWVFASRLRAGWFVSRMFWQGVSDAITEQLLNPHSPMARCRRAVRALRLAGVGMKRVAGVVMTWHRRRRVCQNGETMHAIGTAIGWLVVRRGHQAPDAWPTR